MRYKAVLFDMDGTVLDTLADLHDAVSATLDNFSMPPISREDTCRFVGNGARRLIQLAVPGGTDAILTEQALAWYKEYYGAHCRIRTAPYPGITELMEGLIAADMKLAVVSNKPHAAVCELAGSFFPGLLCAAVGEQEGIRRKPAPDTVLAAAADMELSPADCVYVGDSEVDIVTAKNAGMDCVSVSWGFRDRSVLTAAGASVIADSPEELYARLTGIQ